VPLESLTRATFRRAESASVAGRTSRVTYLRQPRVGSVAGALVLTTLGLRPLRTNCWMWALLRLAFTAR
jgi:hypothetical protein